MIVFCIFGWVCIGVSCGKASGGSTRNGSSDIGSTVIAPHGSSRGGSAPPQKLGLAVLPSEDRDTDSVASALSLLSAHASYENSPLAPRNFPKL